METIEETLKALAKEFKDSKELGIEAFALGNFKRTNKTQIYQSIPNGLSGKGQITKYFTDLLTRITGTIRTGFLEGIGENILHFEEGGYYVKRGHFKEDRLDGEGKATYYGEKIRKEWEAKGKFSKNALEEGTMKRFDEQGNIVEQYKVEQGRKVIAIS